MARAKPINAPADDADEPAAPLAPAAQNQTSRPSAQADFIKITTAVNGNPEFIPTTNIRLITVFDDNVREATVENMRSSGYQFVPDKDNLGLEIQFKEAVGGKMKQLARERTIAELGNVPLLHIGEGRYTPVASIGKIRPFSDKDRERLQRRNEERGQPPARAPQDWKSVIELKPAGIVLSTVAADILIRNQGRGTSPGAKPA